MFSNVVHWLQCMFKYCIFHQKRDFRVRSHVSAKQKIQGKSNEVIPESLCVKTKFPLNVLSEQKYKVRASNDLISKSLCIKTEFLPKGACHRKLPLFITIAFVGQIVNQSLNKRLTNQWTNNWPISGQIIDHSSMKLADQSISHSVHLLSHFLIHQWRLN